MWVGRWAMHWGKWGKIRWPVDQVWVGSCQWARDWDMWARDVACGPECTMLAAQLPSNSVCMPTHLPQLT